MDKTKDGSIVVDKILKDIEELHGKKAIYIKRISYRVGVLNQFLETIKANFHRIAYNNVLTANSNLVEVVQNLKLASNDLVSMQKYIEETIRFIEDTDTTKPSTIKSK